jgi:hypothetical protein
MLRISKRAHALALTVDSPPDPHINMRVGTVDAPPSQLVTLLLEMMRTAGLRGAPGKDGINGKPGKPGKSTRGPRGEKGKPGPPGKDAKGDKGSDGFNGWTPVPGAAEVGKKVYLKVVDWVGGTGPKPDLIGFVGPDGIVEDPRDAVELPRGKDGKPGTPGRPGAPGAPGIGLRGRPGQDGTDGEGDGGYDFTQSTPAAIWTIAHNLGRRPAVQTFSTGGVEFEGQVTHLSDNVLQIDFNIAVAGTARLT